MWVAFTETQKPTSPAELPSRKTYFWNTHFLLACSALYEALRQQGAYPILSSGKVIATIAAALTAGGNPKKSQTAFLQDLSLLPSGTTRIFSGTTSFPHLDWKSFISAQNPRQKKSNRNLDSPPFSSLNLSYYSFPWGGLTFQFCRIISVSVGPYQMWNDVRLFYLFTLCPICN